MTKTYAQLTREIQALQAHAEKLRHSETKDVIARLNASIAQYGLTAEDLHFPGASASSSSSSTRSTRSGASSRTVTSADGVKYSDGPGRVWGGRGPRPAWLREAMAQGRSLESFAATSKATRGAASAPTPAKVSLPPMYSHPKTGQTWSGRGPKPAWLKQGLKKRGATIEDFLISAPASSSTDAGQTPAPAQVAPASRKGDGKNKATAKTGASGKTARKSLAEKVAERTQSAPAAATQAATAAPAKKAAAPKSKRASTAETLSKAPQGQKAPKAASTAITAKPATAPEASGASSTPTPASPAASVKKSSSKANAKGETSSKGSKNAKPAAKKAAPARKNLPVSMAPSSEPAPVPPAASAAPLSGSESTSESASKVDEGETTESGN